MPTQTLPFQNAEHLKNKAKENNNKTLSFFPYHSTLFKTKFIMLSFPNLWAMNRFLKNTTCSGWNMKCL